MMIIGIAGKSEAGKDLIAAHLVQAHGFTRRAFADALKLEYAMKHLTSFAEEPDEIVIKVVNIIKEHQPEARDELQKLGQAKRTEDPDHWIKTLFAWYARLLEDTAPHPLVIPDVRYKAEAEAIKDRGGLVIRVERPGHQNRLTPEQRAHSSECDLDDYEGFDEILVNMDTPDELLTSVDWFLHDFAEVIHPPRTIRELVAAHQPVYFKEQE